MFNEFNIYKTVLDITNEENNINIEEKTKDITYFRDIRKGEFFIYDSKVFLKLEELFIKDVDKGINPVGFEDIEHGSLFGKYRVLNDEVWADVKAGKFKGFSLEGYFGVIESKFIKQKNNMSLLQKLTTTLKQRKVS